MNIRGLTLSFLVIPAIAHGEEVCSGRSQVALRGDPGGPQRASLYPYVCSEVKERREKWVRISIDGWVYQDDMIAKANALKNAGAPSSLVAESPLILTGFDMETGNRDSAGKPTRLVLKLRVKNISNHPVNEWSGVMAVDKAGSDKVLFRYKVSDDEANLAPAAEREVSFYWDKGEEAFEALSGETKESLKITLNRVEAK